MTDGQPTFIKRLDDQCMIWSGRRRHYNMKRVDFGLSKQFVHCNIKRRGFVLRFALNINLLYVLAYVSITNEGAGLTIWY